MTNASDDIGTCQANLSTQQAQFMQQNLGKNSCEHCCSCFCHKVGKLSSNLNARPVINC